MKTLLTIVVVSLLPALLVARDVGERTLLDNSAAIALWNQIVSAEESGDEILHASLLQQFKEQFPGLSVRQEPAASLGDPLPGEQTVKQFQGTAGLHAAAFHVVPPAYTSTPGTATFNGPLANAQRTYQLLIHDSLLTSLVGMRLTGFSMRLPTSASSAWPVADITFTNFDVYLSGSVTPANRSLTFAANVVGPQTQVQASALTVPMASYPFGSSPNDYGPQITFTPWLYSGGHLLVELRHSGFTGTSRSTDAIGTAISGYGTLFSACWTGSYTGTSGSQGNFTVLRLTADSVSVSVGGDGRQVPTTLSLNQNYPNPFNPATTITFGLPASGRVQLNVYDVLGNEVAALVNGDLRAGDHSVQLDASRLASGTYFYRLQSGGVIQTRRLLVLK